ncbi:MAG: Flp pilus assembly protein CpaB [Litorimonas sp.]
MDKNKIIKVVGLFAVAIILFGIVRTLGAPAPADTSTAEATVIEVEYSEVLTAAIDMPLGSRINAESVKWSKWPLEAVTPSLITRDEQPEAIVEFEDAIVRSSIVDGEPINPAKIVTTNGAGVMAALLNPGMRAVTTRISPDTAAGGFIQPGDRVDIVLTNIFDIEPGDARKGEIINDQLVTSATIFENVRVLAIDQTFSSSPEEGADILGSTATFELSPEDVEILQEAEAAGELSLTLRGLTRSNAYSRSAATIVKEKKEAPQAATLTLYRSGQAQRVAIEGQQ